MVQVAVLHAGAVSHLLSRRAPGVLPPTLEICSRRIGWERKVSIAAHLSALAALWYVFGFYAALRTSIIPVFFVFPMAFTLNRLGQHYDIDPNDPAKWGTLMKGHWFWDLAFLNSNYHLEHHYFPGCSVLPASFPSARPGSVLRAPSNAMAKLRPARLRMARREPRTAHRLEPRRWRRHCAIPRHSSLIANSYPRIAESLNLTEAAARRPSRNPGEPRTTMRTGVTAGQKPAAAATA